MARGISFFAAIAGLLSSALLCLGQVTGGPAYTTSSVVNAATQRADGLARYTIATVYGQNLSFTTRAVTAEETKNGYLPTELDGIAVMVNNIPVPLFFVSPGQINFVIPYELIAGDYPLRVVRYSTTGFPVTIHIEDQSPGFFLYNGNTAIATHADGRLITPDLPAKPGEVIIFYCVGLGTTTPDQSTFRLPNRAASIPKNPPLQVFFDGVPVGNSAITYAGITPGCAGLYQINVQLPAGLSASPKIRAQIGSSSSPEAVLAAVQQ